MLAIGGGGVQDVECETSLFFLLCDFRHVQ